jgi:tetratricopeptide (TPR) repeat protein
VGFFVGIKPIQVNTMTMRTFAFSAVSTLMLAIGVGTTADPPKSTNAKTDDGPLVERVNAARKEYQNSLVTLYDYYTKTGDKERAKWVEEELKAYHLATKPSYRLDLSDIPPATLEAKVNRPEANTLFRLAKDYRTKGSGTEFTLNQRRAEIVFQEILTKYSDSDKIADVAYELGDLYEGKSYKQYNRAAVYFERAYQWRKGTFTDARIRAARLYDKQLNERTKAIDLYRDVIQHDGDKERMKEAEKRLAELTSTRK